MYKILSSYLIKDAIVKIALFVSLILFSFSASSQMTYQNTYDLGSSKNLKSGSVFLGQQDYFSFVKLEDSGTFSSLLIDKANGEIIQSTSLGANTNGILQTTDGKYLKTGTAADAVSGYDDIQLTLLDSDGSQIWSNIFGENNGQDLNGFDATETNQGQFVTVGTSLGNPSSQASTKNIHLVKVSASGNFFWETTLPGEAVEVEYSLADQSIYVRGGTYDATNSFSSKIWKFDSDGTLLWSYTTEFIGSSSIWAMSPTASGGVVFSETRNFGPDNLKVKKLDANGNLVWTYTSELFVQAYSINSITETTDGGAAFVINLTTGGGGQSVITTQPILTRLDDNGNFQWSNGFEGLCQVPGPVGSIATVSRFFVNQILEMADGGFALGGSGGDGTNCGLLTLIRTDSDGEVQSPTCTNLLINPDFEDGLNGWSTTGDVTISTDAFSGTKAAEICGGAGSVSQIVVATPGETYTASIQGKLNGIPSYQTSAFRFLDASYAPIPGAPIAFGFPSETEYTIREYSAVAPSNAAYAHLLVYKENNGCVLVDAGEICMGGGAGGNKPDLFADAYTVDDNSQNPDGSTQINSSFILTNQGTAAVPNPYTVTYRISTDPLPSADDYVMFTTTYPSGAAPGSTSLVERFDQIATNNPQVPPGDYWLVLCLDDDIDIDESNELNNCQSKFIEIFEEPNSCNISASTSNFQCDDQGTANPDDDTYSYELLVTNGGQTGNYTIYDGNISVGTGSYGVTKFVNGGLIIAAPFNPSSFLVRDDIDFDCFTTFSQFPPPPCSSGGSDLVVTHVDCPNEYPGPGVEVTWDITVENNGTSANTSTEIYLWNSILFPLAKQLYGSATVPALAPGTSTVVSITVPSATYFPYPGQAGLGQNFIFYGQKYLSFDSQGDTQDYTEADGFPDEFCKKYSTDLQLELTPVTTSLGVYDPVTYQMTVTNNGPVVAYNVEADFDFGYAALGFPIPNVNAVLSDGEFWRQDFSGGGTQPYRFFWYLPELGAGESATAEVTIDPALFVGGVDYIINRTVSSGHNIDPNPSNNTDEIVIPFQTDPVPDFELESFTAAAFVDGSFTTVNANDVITSGENIQFISHFANLDIPEILPDFTITISGYLSTDEFLDNGDVLLASGTRFMDEFSQGFPFSEGGFGAGEIPASTPDGNYYLIVKFDSEDIIAEYNETNNILVLPVGVSAAEDPDLIITDVTCPDEYPGPDVEVTWDITVKNNGANPSLSTEIYLYNGVFYQGTQPNLLYGSATIPGLGANQSATVSISASSSYLPIPGTAGYGESIIFFGEKYLSFDADGSTAAYRESDGFPNVYCKKFSTDLEIQISPVTPSVSPSDPLTYDVIVTNNGPVECFNANVLLYSGYNITGVPYPPMFESNVSAGDVWHLNTSFGSAATWEEHWFIPSLEVGQSETATVTLTPISGGVPWQAPSVTIAHSASSGHNIDPTPSNNTDEVNIPVDGGGGLIDLELDLAQPNNDPAQWSGYPVIATLTNNGDALATGIKVDFKKPSGVVYVGGNEFDASQGSFNPNGNEVWTVGTLAPGESATLEVNYFLLASESPVAWAEVSEANETDVDSTPGNGDSPEVNEDDEASTESTIIPCSISVSVDNIQCEDNGTPTNPNDDVFFFDFTITPMGDDCGTEVAINGQSTGLNGTTTFSSGPNTISLGDVHLGISVIGNPGTYQSVTVTAPAPCSGSGNQPDLTLANLDIQNSPVEAGEILNYDFDISNIGIADASGNFNVKAWISTDNVISPDDIQDGVVPTGNYAAGLTQTDIVGASTLPAGLTNGQYYLILKVDADDDISESNEGNNLISATFTVGSSTPLPDLTVEVQEVIPAERNCYSNPGESFGFLSMRINNYGDDAAGAFKAKFYISEDDILSNDDLLWDQVDLASLGVTGTFAPAFVEPTELVPASLSTGIHYVIFIADEDDEVLEQNENNQTLAFPIRIGAPNMIMDAYSGVSNTLNAGSSFNVEVEASLEANGFPLSPLTLSPSIKIYLGGGPSSTLIGELTFPLTDFAATGSVAKSVPVTIPAGYPEGSTEFQVRIFSNQCELTGLDNFLSQTVDIIASSGDVDLSLNMTSANPNPPIYSNNELTLTISNDGAETATDVVVEFKRPSGTVYTGGNEYSSSQGVFNPFGPETWEVGDIDAGESATLTVSYFLLTSDALTPYAQVLSQNESDVDSAPGNGTCCTPEEDDEATVTLNAFTGGGGGTALQLPTIIGRDVQLQAINPNPVYHGETKVTLLSKVEGNFELETYDVFGRLASTKNVELREGWNEIIMDVSDFRSGTYYLNMPGQNWRYMPIRFVVARW